MCVHTHMSQVWGAWVAIVSLSLAKLQVSISQLGHRYGLGMSRGYCQEGSKAC